MKGLPTLDRLARNDHERGCRNEPSWPYLTISHRQVHDTNALLEQERLHRAALAKETP